MFSASTAEVEKNKKHRKYLCSKLRKMPSANKKGRGPFPRSQLEGTQGELTVGRWDCANGVEKTNTTPVLERLKKSLHFSGSLSYFRVTKKHRLRRTKMWPIYRQYHKRVAYQPTKGRNCTQETSQPGHVPPLPSSLRDAIIRFAGRDDKPLLSDSC